MGVLWVNLLVLSPHAKNFLDKVKTNLYAFLMTNWKSSIFDMETKIKALEHHYQSLIVTTNTKNAHLRTGLQLAHDEMLKLQAITDADTIHTTIDDILQKLRNHLSK